MAKKRKINPDWPTWKVTLTLVWDPKYVPKVRIHHPGDGSTTWEYVVNRLTVKPVKARYAKLAIHHAKKIWRKIFGERVLKFTRSNVRKYEDPWELSYEERQARKLQRLSTIKANRKKRVRRK